jgi:hypothetical protein
VKLTNDDPVQTQLTTSLGKLYEPREVPDSGCYAGDGTGDEIDTPRDSAHSVVKLCQILSERWFADKQQ